MKFEDKLRARQTINVLKERGTSRVVELESAERDALADAVQSLREILTDGDGVELPHNIGVRAEAALARLDAA